MAGQALELRPLHSGASFLLLMRKRVAVVPVLASQGRVPGPQGWLPVLALQGRVPVLQGRVPVLQGWLPVLALQGRVQAWRAAPARPGEAPGV